MYQQELQFGEIDYSGTWYAPLSRNPVDQVLEEIIGNPATRFSAWCAAQQLRERRRHERQAMRS